MEVKDISASMQGCVTTDYQAKSVWGRYLWLMLVVCLVVHICLSAVGWRNTLCDSFGFRQTQTAISTYYTIKEGFRLDYSTPVMGKPWSIPMEFPLFQWITAGLVILTKMPLDQAGRLVSLVFFYLSLIPLYFLLRRLVADRNHIPLFLCIVLASPTYIFWSRTFMIESLALFLSLVFLMAVVEAAIRFRWWLVGLACLAGTLAGLTKVTTFVVFIAVTPVVLYLCRRMLGGVLAGIPRGVWTIAVCVSLVLCVPMAVNMWWVHYADAIKLLNPMTNDFITSKALGGWNFGSIAQRLSGQSYVRLAQSGLRNVSWSVVAGVAYIVLLVFGRKYRREALWSLLCFAMGPGIFFNLYVVHHYYWYANAVFLMLSVGFLVAGVIEDGRFPHAVRLAVLPLMLAVMYGGYHKCYYHTQAVNADYILPAAEAIKACTGENDVIVVYGYDWSSEPCYYSQRKGLMMYRPFPFTGDRMQKVMANLAGEKIGALVMVGDRRGDTEWIAEASRQFNVVETPTFKGSYIDVYPAKAAGAQ